MRQALVVGNWKMHGSRASVDSLLESLISGFENGPVEAAVCPTYVHLAQALARVGQELEFAYPDLSGELRLVSLELLAGTGRSDRFEITTTSVWQVSLHSPDDTTPLTDTDPSRRVREIDVSVNRPGVTVAARRGYSLRTPGQPPKPKK